MKNEKNINYYRSLLHKDSIALLIVAIIFAIIGLLFMGYGSQDAVPIFLKSVMFIVFSIIIICNKKEIKKFIGTLSVIMSCLMILTSIGDWSLFGIVYFLLGIFLGIHSILYLKKFGDYNIQINSNKDDKIKYISLIPIVLTIILIVLEVIFDQFLVGISWFNILILVVNILNIILCIILHRRKIESVLIYIILVISIIITICSGLFLIDGIGQKIRKNYYYGSEKILVEYVKEVEKEL